jgi:di/tricarboxylate transporter
MGAPEFSLQFALVLGVVLAAVVLFVTEWLRVDVAAILIMVSLPLLQLVDGREAFLGLSSTAVISIIAVIIMGHGLNHTGVINRGVKPLLRYAGSSRRRIILVFSGAVAVISSLMQNVGAAALFLPAIQRVSRQTKTPISDLLMPVGFSAILGGTLTLVGSSPLIMLNDLLRPFGLAPFGLFSVTPAGVALVLTGVIYFIVFGKVLLPRKKNGARRQLQSGLNPLSYYPELAKLFELKSPTGNGPDPKVMELCDRYNVHTVALSPDGGQNRIMPPDREMRIPPGSVFAVYGSETQVERSAETFGFKIEPKLDVFAEELSTDISGVVEAVVSPRSSFVGKTLSQIRFRHNYLMAPLAIMHQGRIYYTQLGPLVLEPGDVILMHGRWQSFHEVRAKRDLLFAQSLDYEVLHTHKATAAIACFALAMVLVVFTSLPIAVCLMAGALGMILSKVIRIDEAYQGVDWRTVFLLSGLIPLGLAMQKTQAAPWLAHQLLSHMGTPSPALFIIFVGMMTTVLTLVISNVGATVLLVPLVVDMSGSIGTDPRLAALAVGLASSNAFLLPTHQVNALYLGPGGYASVDFLRAGAPLSILYLLIMTSALVLFY